MKPSNKINNNFKVLLPCLEKLFQERKVKLAYLFGSQAQDKAGPLSDIDIAVLIDAKVPQEEYTQLRVLILTELMAIFKTNKVDVIVLNQVPPLLKYEVICSGRVIFNSDEDLRILFEIRTIKEYMDTKKLRAIQNRYFLERVEK